MLVDQLEKNIYLARPRSGCMATAKNILYQKIVCAMKVESGLRATWKGMRGCDGGRQRYHGSMVLERNKGRLSRPPASRHMQPNVMSHDLCMLISLQPRAH